jgi:hypothetical protein
MESQLLKEYPTATDQQIAEAAIAVLGEYRWRPFPTKPSRVLEYDKFPAQVRKRMNQEPEKYNEFWKDYQVVEYFDQRQTIRNFNDRNEKFLRWMKGIFGASTIQAQKIDVMLNVYANNQEMSEHPTPFNVPANYQDTEDKA